MWAWLQTEREAPLGNKFVKERNRKRFGIDFLALGPHTELGGSNRIVKIAKLEGH